LSDLARSAARVFHAEKQHYFSAPAGNATAAHPI